LYHKNLRDFNPGIDKKAARFARRFCAFSTGKRLRERIFDDFLLK